MKKRGGILNEDPSKVLLDQIGQHKLLFFSDAASFFNYLYIARRIFRPLPRRDG